MIVCPISPKRGFRPLILVRGAGYAIHKKGKLVTVQNPPQSLEFITINSHFSNIMDEYHLIITLGKVSNAMNPYCVSTRCYTELGTLHTLSY